MDNLEEATYNYRKDKLNARKYKGFERVASMYYSAWVRELRGEEDTESTLAKM